MPRTAGKYISCVIAAGLVTLAAGLHQWESPDPIRYLGVLVLALLASTCKVRLPGMTGTYSLSFLFILLSIADFSFAETVVLGCAATVVQCLRHAKQRPKFIQVLFNVANIALSIAVAYFLPRLVVTRVLPGNLAVLLALAASLYWVTNTVLVSGVLSLIEQKPLQKVWAQWFLWSFPFHLVGAAITGLISLSSRYVGWKSVLLVLPLMYLVYFYYRLSAENHSGDKSGLTA